MYLGDPRESLVDLNAPGVWEADNRVEERWQWGAQITDLCDLSPEDYKNSTAVTVKTIQDCGECGGGGGGQTENNKGTASLNDNGEFTLSFEFPVASTLYAFVTFTDDFGNEYSFSVKLDKGSDTATYDVSGLSAAAPFNITRIELGFNEDGSDAAETVEDKKYKYSASTGGGEEDGKVFAFSILCTKTDTLTGDDYQEIIDAQGQGFDEFLASYDESDFGGVDTAQATYVVPCTTVPEWMPADVEGQFFQENSYDFVFITKKSIVEIKEDFSADMENWEKSPIIMGGKTYDLWLRRDLSGAQCPYEVGTGTCDGYDITYTLKINK